LLGRSGEKAKTQVEKKERGNVVKKTGRRGGFKGRKNKEGTSGTGRTGREVKGAPPIFEDMQVLGNLKKLTGKKKNLEASRTNIPSRRTGTAVLTTTERLKLV